MIIVIITVIIRFVGHHASFVHAALKTSNTVTAGLVRNELKEQFNICSDGVWTWLA